MGQEGAGDSSQPKRVGPGAWWPPGNEGPSVLGQDGSKDRGVGGLKRGGMCGGGAFLRVGPGDE